MNTDYLLGALFAYFALRDAPPSRTEQRIMYGLFAGLSFYRAWCRPEEPAEKLLAEGTDA